MKGVLGLEKGGKGKKGLLKKKIRNRFPPPLLTRKGQRGTCPASRPG